MELPPIQADPLGEALHLLRLTGAFYSRCEFSAPWSLELPAFANALMFHIVVSGRGWLEIDGGEVVPLEPGDLVLMPRGERHRLTSEPGLPSEGLFAIPREALSERYEVIRLGGGGAPARMVCGAVTVDHPAARQLIALLPTVIRVEADDSPQQEWMQGAIRLMAAEAKALRPGGEAIVTRLADILVIQAIRAWIERDPAAQTGWLGALRDPQIGRAIALIHRDPARDWSVALLAHESAMSRSAFAARFTELAGEPPMQYVTRWRMQVALTWLREERAGVAELAQRLGYQSEAAFSRAFKRAIGVSPGVARRKTLPSVDSVSTLP